jgi:hypothetical protein
MENKGLIFIPDISGFTRFMHETEIEHGRHIIQELLETLVNANQIGLEISEIEGDAILFFKFGQAPELETLYRQVEKMFCDFHKYLIAYDNRRFCQCKACISAVNLTLKVVAHYGEFTTYRVKNFKKLIGKDIIVAHQLLKNDIDQHEYWLVTQNLLNGQNPDGFTEWMKWYPGSKTTENEQIPFQYTQIGHLKDSIPPYEPPSLEPKEKVKMLSVSREYDAEIKKVFFTAGHLELRHTNSISFVGNNFVFNVSNNQGGDINSADFFYSSEARRRIHFHYKRAPVRLQQINSGNSDTQCFRRRDGSMFFFWGKLNHVTLATTVQVRAEVAFCSLPFHSSYDFISNYKCTNVRTF